MTRKRTKSPSFDAMVKFFMHAYKVPTKKDLDRLAHRLDTLENLMRTILARLDGLVDGSSPNSVKVKKGGRLNATAQVLSIIQKSNKPLSFSDIKDISGLEDKKLRNILYRLGKSRRVATIQRGIYKAF